MFIGTIDLYHFIPLSLTLTLAGGHKVSAKQNIWLHVLAQFSTDQDETWCCVEAIWGEHPDTTFDWDLMNKRNNCCFTDCIRKFFYTDMHMDVYESIWLTLGMMIDTTELYSLIPVWMALMFTLGHRNAWSKKFYTNHLTKFSIDLNWMW